MIEVNYHQYHQMLETKWRQMRDVKCRQLDEVKHRQRLEVQCCQLLDWALLRDHLINKLKYSLRKTCSNWTLLNACGHI